MPDGLFLSPNAGNFCVDVCLLFKGGTLPTKFTGLNFYINMKCSKEITIQELPVCVTLVMLVQDTVNFN